MRCCVDSLRKPANNTKSRSAEVLREFIGVLLSAACGVATADDRQRWQMKRVDAALYVKIFRRIRNVRQQRWQLAGVRPDDVVVGVLQPFLVASVDWIPASVQVTPLSLL